MFSPVAFYERMNQIPEEHFTSTPITVHSEITHITGTKNSNCCSLTLEMNNTLRLEYTVHFLSLLLICCEEVLYQYNKYHNANFHLQASCSSKSLTCDIKATRTATILHSLRLNATRNCICKSSTECRLLKAARNPVCVCSCV